MLHVIILDATNINQRIAERVRELRAARGLSLEALAAQSGVSRSMISLIERGESSPTAVVLDKLAVALPPKSIVVLELLCESSKILPFGRQGRFPDERTESVGWIFHCQWTSRTHRMQILRWCGGRAPFDEASS